MKTSLEDVETVYSELMGDSEPKDFYKKCVKYHLTPTKLWNYLCKFTGPRCHGMGYFGAEQVFQMWCDYLFAAEAIGYDMKNEMVIRPKNLELAHDEATGEHRRRLETARKKEEKARKLCLLLESSRQSYVAAECDWLEYCSEMVKQAKYAQVVSERAQKYAFSDGVWFIRVARDADEVIAEGRALQHCVGGYAQRHMEGKTTICFMRKVTEPHVPTLTIEMQGKKLVQIHGFKNELANGKRQPDPREVHKAFLDTWLDWVKRGSPRDKDGLPVIRKNKKKKEAAA